MNLRSNKAITLVALIITIIILLILAGVSLSMVLGENGLINKAQAGVNKYQESAIKEEAEIAIVEVKIKMVNEQETRTMAEYVKSFEGGVDTGNGVVYEENDSYFFMDNENNVVELKNINGNLEVEKVIGKRENIVRKALTYDLNGGTGTLPESRLRVSGTNVNIYFDKQIKRDGYRFIGYSDTIDGEAKYTADGEKTFIMPTNEVTLYAVWKAEERMKFDSNYKGNYTVTSGTVGINDANGIYPTSYPSGGGTRITSIKIDKGQIVNVGSKFEIVANAFFNNNAASRIGYFTIELLNKSTTVVYIQVADSWTANLVMNLGYGYLDKTLVNYYGENKYAYGSSMDGNLKIVGDGTKVSAYIGNTLINSINCSEGFSFDSIVVKFSCYQTYPAIGMGVRDIYIHELE